MRRISITLFAVLLSACSFAQVGIGTTNPNTTLDVRGSLAVNSRSFSTTSETVLSTDFALLFTGNSACTLTLPDATGCIGRIIHVKNTKTGTVPVLTIATTASQTIDGLSSIVLNDPNESVNIVSDGSNWKIMGQSLPAGSGTSWTQGGNTVGSIKKLGTIDNYDFPFITNNVERMRLTATGLGIGTTNPTEKLQIDGNLRLSGADRAIFFDATADPYAGIKTVTRSNETTELMMFAGNDVSGSYGADRIRLASQEIHFATSNVGSSGINSGDPTSFYSSTTSVPTRMMINEKGSVGIGTTSFDATNPERLLVDAGTTTNTPVAIQGTIDNYFQLYVQNFSNGNSASTDIVATANNGNDNSYYIDMGINSAGYSNSNSNILNGSNTAYLYANAADFYIGNGATGKDLMFFTNTGAVGNSTANGNERMRITSGGTVSINTGYPNTSYKLYVNGSAYATGGWYQASDRRLKTNIYNLKYGLKEVMKLQPVSYHWIDTAAGKEEQVGLIAQDLQKVIPEVVHGNEKNETLSVNYTELIPVLINAIKEQQKEIEDLKQRVKALEHQ